MITISIAQLKSDITPKLKGTTLRQIVDFEGVAGEAAARVLLRIQPEETRRTVTLSTPFYDNLNDYALPSDYKRMIDIKPTANRQDQPGRSIYSQTTPRQFDSLLDPDTYSIGWNNMIRSLRAQCLPAGTVATMDTFDGPTANGSWSAGGQASGLYTENLNYVEGSASLGFNLSAIGGIGSIVNSTAAVADLSALRYNDASLLFFYIPSGFSSRFTSFTLRRGSSASAYKEATATAKADGTAFTDGWNLLIFNWNNATTTGSPDDTRNTYRYFATTYTVGTAIPGCLIDNWTDSLGHLYQIEYYSEYMFRTAAGVWIPVPTQDSDLVCVSPSLYEILKAEMMVTITQNLRQGAVREQELTGWMKTLNGDTESKYGRDSQFRGLYADYVSQFPSSAIMTSTRTYEFDL